MVIESDRMLTSKRFVRRWGSYSEEPSESSVCLWDHCLGTCQPEDSITKEQSSLYRLVLHLPQGLFCIILYSNTYLNIRVTWPLALFHHAPSLQNCEHIQIEMNKL